jgi:hypothetical protein
MLDIFKGDAFSVMSLTDAIVNVPFVPGRVGQVIDWNEGGISTLAVAIEQEDNVLKLINPTPRGGQGDQAIAKNKRTIRDLRVPHYEIPDAIMADEVQGVRAFGSENQVMTVQGLVNRRLADHVALRLDPTLEYQRLGAVKGVILNADGSTLYDLFSEFGVSQAADTGMALTTYAATGPIRQKCAGIIRTIATNLGGVPFSGVHVMCGDNFFDALIGNQETRETFLQQQEASQLRAGIPVYQTFNYGGIVFENYRGAVGTNLNIDTDEGRAFPVGVPGLFRTVYAPADYIETVNTIGLPRYAKIFAMENGKGVNLEVQMNALSYCTRPKVLMRLTKV